MGEMDISCIFAHIIKYVKKCHKNNQEIIILKRATDSDKNRGCLIAP